MMIQTRALLLLLIGLPHMGNALNKPVLLPRMANALNKPGLVASSIRTFTTAAIPNRKTGTSNSCTGNGSSAQKIGTQFVASEVPTAHVLFRPQPNCNGFVGPTQYLVTTNSDIISYNKFTGQPDGIINTDIASFMGDLAIADARCTFDRWGQRWMVLTAWIAIGAFHETSIALAWSDGPIITPETQWTLRIFTPDEIAVPETPPAFPDSPNIATDQNAVYVNMTIYDDLSSTPVWGGQSVTALVIPQSSFITGNPFVFTAFYGLFNFVDFYISDPPAPSPNNYDPNPQFGYIVQAIALQNYPVLLSDSFLMYRILNPASSSPSLYPPGPTVIQPVPPVPPISLTAIPNYANAANINIILDTNVVPHKGNLYGSNGLLQVGGGYGTSFDVSGIHIRNHQLYLVTVGLVNQTGAPDVNGDRVAILWYQYDLTGDPSGEGSYVETESTVPVLIQSGTIYDPTVTDTPIFYWNPAIMTNKNGDLVVTGNYAGVNDYIQAFYAGRKACDPLGTLRDIVPLTNNTNSYNYGTLNYDYQLGQRWGDYCGICPDPCNDLDIWLTNQIVGHKDLWSILTTQLKPMR